MRLEQYRDLKWYLRQSSAFKIFSLREGWSFQTRKTEPTCESWGALSAAPELQPQEKEQEGQLHHHQLPTLHCSPAKQPPRAERGRPTCTWRTKWSPVQVNTLAECQTWPDPRDRISESGSWRAQGSRPAASPAHLHPPAPPCWALVLLPPTPIPPPAAWPIPWAAGSSHPSHHFTLPKPSFFVGLSAEELMLLNCGVGEDSRESLGLRGDPTSPFWRRSALGFLWKEWC